MSGARGFSLVGTDTEVGKTVMSAALLMALRKRGQDWGYLKPVASDGQDVDGWLVSPDALLVQELARLHSPWERMNPLCLPHSLSPLAAARLENTEINLDRLRRDISQCMGDHEYTLVEGVGGVLTPLATGYTALDLMAELGLPVVVVGRANLGTINHTLLTINAVRDRGLTVIGFCFSGPPADQAHDPALEQNPGLISEFGDVPFLGALPWLPALTADNLAEAAARNLNLDLIAASV
jgi:dethiobiotin synthetase